MGFWEKITSGLIAKNRSLPRPTGAVHQSGSSHRRVCILALDGTPYPLIERFVKEGVMPNLSEILRAGSFVPMDVTVPEISSVAWPSLYTGVNPGKHGIYGFMDLNPQSYDLYFPNSHHVAQKTLWEMLGEQGKRSVILNVPSTYPAKPLNGILVAGFVAIDLARATYPPSLVPMLEQSGYILDVDATKAQQSLELYAEELKKSLEIRLDVLERLFLNEPWDLFLGVFTETDRLHHYFWAAVEDSAHPFHEFFLSLYRRIDEFIGKAYDRFHGQGLFMVISDHGFCKIQDEVYLNHWLKSEGYLSFASTQPRSLHDIDPKTRVFIMEPSRVYIHLKGRYPQGSVLPGGEYDRLRDEMKERLLKLTINGVHVMSKVFFKEEVYHGPLLNAAPDLVLLPNRGFDLKGALNKGFLAGHTLFTGMHTHDDALMYINQPIINKEEKVNVMDITPTVLSYLGIPIPEGMDGTVLI